MCRQGRTAATLGSSGVSIAGPLVPLPRLVPVRVEDMSDCFAGFEHRDLPITELAGCAGLGSSVSSIARW
jgi:hypothetical protein